MKQDHKNLVLLETTLDVCQLNLEKQMNVEENFYMCHLKVHDQNIRIKDLSYVYVTSATT